MQRWGRVCHAGVGWVHHTEVDWTVKNFTGYFDLTQVGCSVFLEKNYRQLLSGQCGRRLFFW